MKRAKLPPEILEQMWAHGLGGMKIYIPRQRTATLVERFTPKVLELIETTYEHQIVIFKMFDAPRPVLTDMLGIKAVATRFNLKPRTAALATAAAWKLWQVWFPSEEKPRLVRLRELAEEINHAETRLIILYRDVREKLRYNQEITPDDHKRHIPITAEIILKVIDLAKSSLESRPWKESADHCSVMTKERNQNMPEIPRWPYIVQGEVS